MEYANDIKSYLSLVYGDNVEVLFNQFVFVWDDVKDEKVNKKHGSKYFKKQGKILFITGETLIKDYIDDAIPLKSGTDKIILGYAIMLEGSLDDIYNIKSRDGCLIYTILILSDDLKFERAKLKVNYYSKDRPDIRLEYRFKTFIGKFDTDANLKYFYSL